MRKLIESTNLNYFGVLFSFLIILMYSTLESKSQIDAFNTIKKQFQNNVISHKFHNSGCSCCLSEEIYILCKINNTYKLYCYNAYLKHEKKCLIIRCSCNDPFVWKNVLPIELNLNENEDVILSLANYDVNNGWYEEYKLYLYQQIENKKIYEYNELCESDELDFFNESDFVTKNKKYYFG